MRDYRLTQTAPALTEPRPTFSLVVVTYNGESVVRSCLDSINALEFRDFEVIIVDNASTDKTLKIVTDLIPTAKIVRSSLNRGYGAGCNIGSRFARGNLLTFLNQDVAIAPSYLREVHSKMLKDESIGICGGVILSEDGRMLVSAGQKFDVVTCYALDYGFWSRRFGLDLRDATVFSPNGAVFVIRRDVFNMIGGFDEEMFMYFDETDLAWRAQIAGFRVVCVAQAVAFHRIDPRRAHADTFRYFIDRNSLLSATQNFELRNLLKYLPTALATRIAGIVALSLLSRRKHARSSARAVRDFFALLPRRWKRRKITKSFRRLGDGYVLKNEILATPQDVLRVFLKSLLPNTSRNISADPKRFDLSATLISQISRSDDQT